MEEIYCEFIPVKKNYILSIDQGTSSTRSIVYNHEGHVVAAKQQEIQTFHPEDGWAEQDPLEIWQSVVDTALGAIRESNIDPSDIAASGITNQRETIIAWNAKTGVPNLSCYFMVR